MTDLPTPPPRSELLIYQTEDGRTRIQVRLEDETVWLTQKLMAELFQKDVRTINEHIRNIFAEGELSPESVIRNFRITAADGKTYDTQHYNLDVVISVGYRVKSHRGTQFRIWATQRLREYIVKGFTLDDERLVQSGLAQTMAGARPHDITETDLGALPPLVQRYLRFAGVVGTPRVQGFRARLTGRIRRSATAPWMPFRAEQHNFYDPPRRYFWMEATRGGLPVVGLHAYDETDASMRIRLLSLVPVVDLGGTDMMRTETVTIFNDLCLLAPGSLLDPAIRWREIDGRSEVRNNPAPGYPGRSRVVGGRWHDGRLQPQHPAVALRDRREPDPHPSGLHPPLSDGRPG